MEFSGTTIWITGASSGIGTALAGAFARAGARLILSGRRMDALAQVSAAIGGDNLVLPFEVTDIPALPGVVARAWDWHGGIDLLVNNAGISQRSLAIDTSMDVYRRIMEVDFFAPLALTQLLVPRMITRGSGHIAAVSSVAGKVGSPLRSGYCAAKHALIGYCDALRAECETAYGIGVTSILPGSVRTAIATNALLGDGAVRGVSDTNIDNGMDPDEVARQVLEGLRGEAREILIAEGGEAAAAHLRATRPDTLFDALAREGARLAQVRSAGGSIDPAKVGGVLE